MRFGRGHSEEKVWYVAGRNSLTLTYSRRKFIAQYAKLENLTVFL